MDEVVYPHKPDRLIGSENDGSGENLSFRLKMKTPKDKSLMPRISDAYHKRYKEYR